MRKVDRELHSSDSARGIDSVAALWEKYHVSELWYRDAVNEAQTQSSEARHREIIFAVCFAETYLYELVRDVFTGEDQEIFGFFPQQDRRGIRQRWKEVVKELLHRRLIKSRPNYGDTHAEEWIRLIEFRDGLVHANASRPKNRLDDTSPSPVPSMKDLFELEAGWALGVVVEHLSRLHEATDVPVPGWIQINS